MAAMTAAPISNQPIYNLYERGIEAAVLPTSARCGLGQIVYSPLAQGVLTGKYRSGVPADSRAACLALIYFDMPALAASDSRMLEAPPAAAARAAALAPGEA